MSKSSAEFVEVEAVSSSSERGFSVVSTKELGYDAKDTRRLLRKLDRALLPFLSLLYLLSFLDRANIGNAKLAGLEADLNMTGKWDYGLAVSVFFPFYVAAEIPSNIAMKRFRPSLWIPSIMLAWGLCTVMLGFVKNYSSLLIVRSALGFAEGGLFPGITYFITMWYRRHECGFRMAIFFSAATMAGAFGGLLARGIMEMKGVAGLSGWSWIFILEGLATMVVATIAYFAMHDYPSTSKFLNKSEKEEVERRLTEDRGILSEEFKVRFILDALTDVKIWANMLIAIGFYVPLYSISTFLPTIVKTLGYSNEIAQIMTVPPYIAAGFCTIGSGYFADRSGQRGIFVAGFASLAILGFTLLATVQNNAVKYFACILVACGIYPNIPQAVTWTGNNIGGSLKRAVGIAMQVGFGNLGGAIAGFVIRPADAPNYVSGHLTLLASTSMSFILAICLSLYLRRENARRDRIYKAPADYTLDEKMAETDNGDRAPFFRYTV